MTSNVSRALGESSRHRPAGAGQPILPLAAIRLSGGKWYGAVRRTPRGGVLADVYKSEACQLRRRALVTLVIGAAAEVGVAQQVHRDAVYRQQHDCEDGREDESARGQGGRDEKGGGGHASDR